MKRLPLLALFLVAAALCTGCSRGPSKQDIASSQVGVLIDKEFEEKTFLDEGKTGQIDPWGQEISWLLKESTFGYTLEVRSAGPDQLPKTRDDIFRTKGIRTGEGMSERLAKGLSRGTIRGIKEGLFSKSTQKDEKPKPKAQPTSD
ncbi:MAG: hypothetical protein K2W82_16755 [Candidatus Obscuribacterales bacterium]|nr:hypothetical protein [Candidatus Obscuribacterales bacterium]